MPVHASGCTKPLDGAVRRVYKMGMVHLADYMASRNLSDDAVATSLKCSRATVSRIRRRKVRPEWKTIEKIKDLTDGLVTADDFADLPDQPERASA